MSTTPTDVAEQAHVVHAYGVISSDAVDTVERDALPQRGIAGSPVRVLPLSGIAVIVGDLAADRFGEKAWRDHAEDPAWLEPVARGHHEVLQTVAATVDVLPLRLPGIYRDDDELTRLLAADEESLLERLHVVSGHQEWGVHVHLLADASTAATSKAPASGRDYLIQRKQAAADRDTARERRHELLAEVYAALAEVSARSVVNRPQDPALSGRDEPMLLNSAHLVARGSRDAFFARADEASRSLLEPADMVMEISGPWPPYNFAVPREEPGEETSAGAGQAPGEGGARR